MQTQKLRAALGSVTSNTSAHAGECSPLELMRHPGVSPHREPPSATSNPCLACRSNFNERLADWSDMPLSVLGLPKTQVEALGMTGFVLDVRQCSSCGHVFHAEFDYKQVPYRDSSNLVYNEGASWKAYQDELAAEWISTFGLRGKRVVEIGCGEGLFLERLARADNHCIGFEPGSDAARARARGIECYAEYFKGTRLHDLDVDAVVCRHVIEHLAAPIDFLEEISIACREASIAPLFLAEVPCIEKAIEQNRINDFLYEHVSNFTRRSLQVLFERAGFEVLDVRTRFNDEVVTIAARPKLDARHHQLRSLASQYRCNVDAQIARARVTLEGWRAAGERVALWGGTGKGAALINMVGITPDLADLVVDSDERKVGSFVPGTGQEIRSPRELAGHAPERILICTNWRARDIEREIREVHGLETDLFVLHRHAIVPLTADLEL
jgi:SAM-dependent methyltransferase